MDATERERLRALCETIPDGDVTPCCGRAGEDGHHSSWALGATPHGAALRAWVAGPLDLLALARTALPALIDDADAADARIAKAERERDEARAGFRALAEERDLLRAEVERLREQARVWRTLAHDGSIASRDLGVIGATESALALAACARRAGQHAAQGAEAERETCAMIATPYAARWPCAGDIVAKIRARGAGGGE